jgi:3-deoxy-D-manno-oct-2-ulosonic acid (Kdo) hydroxylase
MLEENIDIKTWDEPISQHVQNQAINSLEQGHVLYFPFLPFHLHEGECAFLSPDIVDPKSKNISYDLRKDRLGGTLLAREKALELKEMVKRYAIASRQFLERLIPHYEPFLYQARTSFRPVEISGRKSSYRKDDTLLHVDSFPANPTKGKRILRIFTNINQNGKPRVWRLGEPFEHVVQKMMPRISHPIWGVSSLLKLFGVTKDYRTPYDHYMLQIHDTMKGDIHYQKAVTQREVLFPPGSTWIVYTDQVSHAAMAGQHVLEQTFHLPVIGIKNSSTSPLKVLERYLNRALL